MAFEYQNFASLGVNLNRQAYGPLDISNVFKSVADLEYYTTKGRVTENVSNYWYESADKKIVPYPYEGQIVALVANGNVTAYILSEITDTTNEHVGEFTYKEVGKAPELDNATITTDEEGKLVLVGAENATNIGKYAQLVEDTSAPNGVRLIWTEIEIPEIPEIPTYEADGKSIDKIVDKDDKNKNTFSIHGFTELTAADDKKLVRYNATTGKIEWAAVSDVVEGDTNTITRGDGKSIDTAKIDPSKDELIASLHGFDEAKNGEIAIVVETTASPDGSTEASKTLAWTNLGTEIDTKISAYDTATVQPLAEKVNALTGAFQYVGESTTNPETDGASVEGVEFVAGNVVTYGTKEYVFDGAKWIEFGDEGSHVLKSRKIIAGEGLEGGGELSADVTISIKDGAITAEKLADGVIPTIPDVEIERTKGTLTPDGAVYLSSTDSAEGHVLSETGICITSAGDISLTEASLDTQTIINPSENLPLALVINEKSVTEEKLSEALATKINGAVQSEDFENLVKPLLPTVPVYTGKEAITISDEYVIDLITNEDYLVEKVNEEKTELTLSDSVIASLGKADTAIQSIKFKEEGPITGTVTVDSDGRVAKIDVTAIDESIIANLTQIKQTATVGSVQPDGSTSGVVWGDTYLDKDSVKSLDELLKIVSYTENDENYTITGVAGLMTPEQAYNLEVTIPAELDAIRGSIPTVKVQDVLIGENSTVDGDGNVVFNNTEFGL